MDWHSRLSTSRRKMMGWLEAETWEYIRKDKLLETGRKQTHSNTETHTNIETKHIRKQASQNM